MHTASKLFGEKRMAKKKMEEKCYHYRAEIIKIIDGDTIRARVKAVSMLPYTNFLSFKKVVYFSFVDPRRETKG